MRIAMVSEHASPLAVVGEVDAGGQNVHVAALASALAERGHCVDVYTRRDDPALPPTAELRPRVAVHHVNAGPPERIPKDELLPYMPALARGLRTALRATQPTVLHAHFWMSGLAAAEAARGVCPVVLTYHALGSVKRREQGSADTSPPERTDLEAELSRRVDRVIASCTDEKRELVALGAPPARIDVVPSGVDCSWFVPDGPRANQFAPDGFRAPQLPPDGSRAQTSHARRLLVVGRLVPRKGVQDAIEALRWIDDAELLVAGGPPAEHLQHDREVLRLKALAEQLGVSHRVHLLGQIPHTDLPALIRSADAVLCLPWYEPFGIVPLEAMACGVPVIGTAVGGLLDTVIDGVTGTLLPPRQPRRVAAAVSALLADEPLRLRYGIAGRERAKRYTWTRVAQLTERTYLRALVAQKRSGEGTQRTVGAGRAG